MSAKVVRTLGLFVCIFTYVGLVHAQTRIDSARFALEVHLPDDPLPSFSAIPEQLVPNSSPCSIQSVTYSFKLLAIAAAKVERPSDLRWKICVRSDTVYITPTFYYGKADKENPASTCESSRQETLETQSGKLNDSITFSEMARLGLEPITVRVVTVQPEVPYLPSTSSEAPSVQIDYSPVDRNIATLTLRNSSGKAVVAYRMGYFLRAGSTEVSDTESYVVSSGAIIQSRVGIFRSGHTVNHIPTEDPLPQYMVLQSVLFSDGSYEGDAQSAAEMSARVFGFQEQSARINRLAEPILTDASLDDNAKIDRIRTGIQRLSSQPDPDTIAQFHLQFTKIPGEMLTRAEQNISAAMKNQNDSMSESIRIDTPLYLAHRSYPTLAQWWAMIRHRVRPATSDPATADIDAQKLPTGK